MPCCSSAAGRPAGVDARICLSPLSQAAITTPPTGDIRKGDGSFRAILEAEVALQNGSFYKHIQVWPPPAKLAPPRAPQMPPYAQPDEEVRGAAPASKPKKKAARRRRRGGDDDDEDEDDDGGGDEEEQEEAGGEGDEEASISDELGQPNEPVILCAGGPDRTEPLTPSEARRITDVLSGAVRQYQMARGYYDGDADEKGVGGYAFMGGDKNEVITGWACAAHTTRETSTRAV